MRKSGPPNLYSRRTRPAGPDNRVISNLKDWSDREISEALLRYKTEDGTTVMHRLARGYSIEDIETIAGTYKSADE